MPPDVSVLTNPDAFFRERRRDPSLLWPALIVTAIALLAVLSSVLQSRAVAAAMSDFGGPGGGGGGGGGIGSLFQVIGMAFTVGVVYVRWLLYAVAFHLLSMVFDGDGDFKTTFALVGWGFLPYAFSAVASLALDYYRFNVVGLGAPSEMSPEAMAEFFQSLNTGPLVALSGALSIVFVLWAAFLWTFAVRHARGLELPDAAKTVAAPALIGIAFATYGVLTALQIL